MRRAAGLGEAELVEALDEAVRSGMIEEVPGARAAPAASPTSWCGGRSTTGCRARAGPSSTCASGRRSRRPGRARAARSRTSPTTSPPPRRSATAERAVEYNLLRRARAAAAALAFDEAAARLRTALDAGTATDARRRCSSSSAARATAPATALDALRGVPARGRHRARELGDAQLLARAAIGYEDACWRPGMADQGAVELLEEAAVGARRRRTPSCGSGCSAGSPARSTSRGTTTAAPWRGRSAIAMARRLDDRAGLATVLMRSYWSRGTTSLEEILAMLTEAVATRRGARQHRDPRRGDGLAGAGLRRPLRPRVGAARGRGAARDGGADGAAVHAPRGRALRLGDRALRRAPRRGRGARAALARVEPAADRARRRRASTASRCSASRREQGRLAELAPVVRVLAGDRDRERPVAPRPRRAARRARDGGGGAARARAPGRRRARPVPRVALARLARLPRPTPARRSATRRWRRSSTRSSSRSPAAT